MATKYLDSNGLLYFWQKLKATFALITHTHTASQITDLTVPVKSITTPSMDGTASVGTETAYAAGDHVHPPRMSLTGTSTGWDLMDEYTGDSIELRDASEWESALDSKQDTLVSGTNIKTINGTSILGSGNMDIVAGVSDVRSDGTSVVTNGVANIDTFTNPTSSADGMKGLVPAPPMISSASVRTADYRLTASGRWGIESFSKLLNNNTQSWRKTTTIGGATYHWTVDFDNATSSVAGFMSPSDKTKLDGIASGAEVNVQSDWNETDTSSDAYIANKPTIPEDQVFIATYDVTSYADVRSAINSGKIVICKKEFVTGGGVWKHLPVYYVDASNIVFLDSMATGDTHAWIDFKLITCKTSGWSEGWGIQAPSTTSPTFSGTPTAPTATAGTNNTQIATTAFVTNAVSTAVTGATSYQGIAPTSFAPTDYTAGWYWIIGTAGTYCGQTCEAGDMIFCKTAASAYSDANFDVVQTNLDITSITNAEIDTIVV